MLRNLHGPAEAIERFEPSWMVLIHSDTSDELMTSDVVVVLVVLDYLEGTGLIEVEGEHVL